RAAAPATLDVGHRKPGAGENIRGESKPIPTKAEGVRVCEHLPKVAAVMDRCALVRSLHHTITDHGAGARYVATGHPPSAALQHPALGALAAKLLPAAGGVPPYVALDGAGGVPRGGRVPGPPRSPVPGRPPGGRGGPPR